MKVITMAVWRRADVLKKTLHALEHATGIGDYTLVIHCDGGGNQNETRAVRYVCRDIDFAETLIKFNRGNLGCNENTRRVLHRGFELSDYVIHVEEDIVIAPDALLYMEWAKQFRNRPEIWMVSMWRHPSGWLHESGTPFPLGQAIETKVCHSGGLLIWGWGTWRDRWETMEKNWTTGDDKTLSWDTHLTAVRHKLGKFCICPLVSRAVNVGDGGIHRDAAHLDYWAGSTGFQRNANYVLSDADAY